MKKFLIACFAASILVAGCGGGGGGGNGDGGGNPPPPPPPTGSSAINLLVSGSRHDSYDKLFLRLYSVEAVGPNNTTVPIFKSTRGLVFDARALNKSGTNRFQFIASKAVPKGTYTQLRFLFDKDISAVARGSNTLDTSLDFAEPDADGNKLLTLAINENIQAETTLVVHLPLNTWALDRNKFIASLQKGDTTGLNDPAMQARTQFEGTISNLTGTDRPTFTLPVNDEAGAGRVKVVVDENTNVYADDGLMNPVFSNGSNVHVRGYWSSTQNAFVATSLRIHKVQKIGDKHDVEGRVLSVSGDTFTMRIDRVEGFFPQLDTKITVTTSANTVYFDRSGIMDTKEIFFSYINSSGKDVEVEGSYNFTTNTLAAAKIKAIDEDKEPETEVRGTQSNVNAGARTFTVTVTDWAGAYTYPGKTYTVTLNADAKIQDRLGNTITVTQFFEALPTAGGVRATGSINGGTLAAKSVRLR